MRNRCRNILVSANSIKEHRNTKRRKRLTRSPILGHYAANRHLVGNSDVVERVSWKSLSVKPDQILHKLSQNIIIFFLVSSQTVQKKASCAISELTYEDTQKGGRQTTESCEGNDLWFHV